MSAITGVGRLTADALDTPPIVELLRGERLRSLNVETTLLLAAARLALQDAGRDQDAVEPDELGVVVATCHAGHRDYAELFLAGLDPTGPRVNPARGPQTGLNAPAAMISIRLGAGGPNATLSNGPVGGLDALSYAADALAAERAAAMLVCGVDVVPEGVGAAGETEQPGAAVVIVLEPGGTTQPRPERIRALVAGVATACSAGDDAADAPARALHEACRIAGVEPEATAQAAFDANDGEAESTAAVTQLGDAASGLQRRELRGPLLVRAADDACAGAAILVERDWQAA